MSSITEPIRIQPFQPEHFPEVSRLLVHSFRGKFQALTKLSDDVLASFFNKLFHYYPSEDASCRIVAIQEDEVVGTLELKWYIPRAKEEPFPSWSAFREFGTWTIIKLLFGLQFLNHEPRVGECYISEVAVHPNHQGKGIGKLLLRWAMNYACADERFDTLSLHVSHKNERARMLYELLSFQTVRKESSLIRYLLFHERQWHFMTFKPYRSQ
ncbi:GNAT family N-acetyltransferase [Paenibacillus sp. J5C_2022]|uniref:GNAT family N-acetyltransferase n=1 Tax=Paenibacillus sp. J5C2022 TaxID=2977129 RepID=UPI0021CEA069|nr:GNAT family N-acetyltransferase [Paenibacillus sp. J5C2022]MCU6707891.1 GNAT family N-acetyltransferase [Paenibacillus sp. J5C2022]